MKTKIWTTIFLMLLSLTNSTSTASTTTTLTTAMKQPATTTQGIPRMSLTSTSNSPTVGSSVTLTCQATGYKYGEIRWRGPSEVFILFSACLRITEYESTHITYISVTCGDEASVLTINNFNPGRDAGSWSCSGQSMIGTKSDSASITLTAVASNVENIQITTELAFIDHYDTISLLYGEKETIQCSADCQNGCQFIWHLDNQIVSSSNELVIDLQSSPPTPGGRYMCTVSSGGDSLTKNVTIKRKSRDSIIFSPSDDILNVNEGDNVTVICDRMDFCSGLNGVECTVSWNTIFSTSQYELKFYNIALDKTGRYYCIHDLYDQYANSREKIYRSVQINVGTPRMSLTSTNNSPAVGSSVTLTCQAPGYKDGEIRWRGPSGVFILFSACFRLTEHESPHITYISVTCGDVAGILTINNFDPGRDAGSWSCSGQSMIGKSDSASITLTAVASNVENIKIATELAFIDYYDTISLLYGEKETINCSADCQNGCQFTWHLGNQVVSSSNELVIDLQSSPPTPSGRYMCTVSSGGDSLTRNVTVNSKSRDTIIFSPSVDILNVNEGDNVTVICDGKKNDYACSAGIAGVECTDSWYTMSTSHELKFNNMALDKTGRYYCIHDLYDQYANTRDKMYRSVQINVIATTTASTTTATTTEQPNTTTQELTPTSILTSMSTSDAAPSTSDAAPSTSDAAPSTSDAAPSTSDAATSTSDAATSTSDAAPTMPVTSSVSVTTSYTSIITSLSSTSLTTTSVASGSITSLQVVSSSDPQLIQEGSDLTLTCQADCQPVDSCVYTWNFNDNIIANTKECQMISITRQATGTYTCSASNEQTMSDAIDVKVNYPPSAMTITRNPDVSTYNVQSTITLTCNVDCVPKATITWAKGSQVLKVSNTFNYLSLSNVLTGDSGEYTCIADNGIGNQMTATTSISVKYILYGGSGASSIHWVFLHKILLMVVIVSILQ